VLRAVGVDVDVSPLEAAKRLGDPALGWAYLDQSAFCPKLHDLVGLRTKIVKRPLLTTVEVLAKPVAGRKKTHLVTGYVHKPYPPVYAMLARHVGYDSALIIRGVEGGIIPSLRQAGRCYYYQDRGEEQGMDVEPSSIGIDQPVRGVPLPEDLPKTNRPGDEIAVAVDIEATARSAARAGMDALRGQTGPTYDSLVYSGALVLQHLGRVPSLAAGADRIRAVLDSGKAVARVR
jgi:anthranilate phosphoribosyltransferase